MAAHASPAPRACSMKRLRSLPEEVPRGRLAIGGECRVVLQVEERDLVESEFLVFPFAQHRERIAGTPARQRNSAAIAASAFACFAIIGVRVGDLHDLDL